MKSVFCLGDICMDLVLPYGSVLRSRRGEPISRAQTDVVFRHGGSAANTAAALLKLGVPVSFCGTVGADLHGAALKSELAALGADVSALRCDPNVPQLLIAIVVDETGERTAFATQRTNASQHRILPEQVPDDLCDRIVLLHTTGVLLREEPAASVVLQTMRRCRDAGIPIALDVMARIESRSDPVFLENLRTAASYATILFGSVRDELPLLTDDDSEDALLTLAKGDRIVCARDGSRGAVVYTERGVYRCPAFSVPVADTIGAGDAYNAGFLSAYLRGASLADANREANAVAAICVTHTGGRATPTQKELQTFLQSH